MATREPSVSPTPHNQPADDVGEDPSQSTEEHLSLISPTHQPETSISDLDGAAVRPEQFAPDSPNHQTVQLVSQFGGTEASSETENAQDDEDAKKNVTTVDISHVANAEDFERRLWTPFVLTKLGLYLFIIAFFTLLIAIAALFLVSIEKNGIASVNSNYYYLWTYGPTAVFALIAALWGQVQYRALQMMAWLLMSQGYTSASQSILQDYTSPWSVISLIKAARQKHFLVVLAISGGFLIKLAIVFATGLFSISTAEITYTTPFILETSFNNSANFGDPVNIPAGDSFPVIAAYSINQLNATPQLGVNSNHAFQVFHDGNEVNRLSSPYIPTYRYQASVDILTTDLSCEQATATAVVVNQIITMVTLKSQSCSIDIWANVAEVTSVLQLPMNEYSFQHFLWGCNDKAQYRGLTACEPFINISDDTTFWVYFSVPQSDDSVSSYEFPQRNMDGSIAMILQRYVAMACQPSITTSRGQVAITTDPSTGDQLSKIVNQEVTEIPALAINSSSLPLPAALLTQVYCSEYSSQGNNIVDPLFFTNTTQDNISSLSDPNLLSANLRLSIGSTMAQAAKKYLMTPTNGTVRGTVIKPDVRLVIHPVSFGIILAAICLALVNSLALLWIYTPCRVISRDPGSIGGLAAILARSRNASAPIQGTGSWSEEKLSQLLTGQEYHTKIGDQGDFLIEKRGENMVQRNVSKKTDIERWNPFSLSTAAFTITLLLSISLIATLEALVQKSEKSNGIANVNDQSYVRYLWKFLPTLAILAVQTLFEMIGSSVRTVQPYHILRQGRAPESVIMENQQRKLAIYAFFDALPKRQWALIFAIFPVLLAPFLPISISGLYTTSSMTTLEAINVTQLDLFNWSGSYHPLEMRDGLAQLLPSMVLRMNLSYPQWTYEKYAISAIEIPMNVRFTGANGADQLSIVLPAAYVDMNCSITPSDRYQLVKGSQFTNNVKTNWPTLMFQNLGPENCQFSTNTSKTNAYPAVNITTPAQYWSLQVDATVQSQSQDGCPTMIFAFGKMDGHTISTAEASVVQCRPMIGTVNLNVTLLVPSLQIDPTLIPSPINSTQSILYKGTSGNLTDSSTFIVTPSNLNPTTSVQNLNVNFDYGSGGASGETSEGLFVTMIEGLNGTTTEELATNPESLIEGIQRVYGLGAAQLIGSGARQAYPTNSSADLAVRPTLSANLLNKGQVRLKQSIVSTRIIQALLATMVLCAAATWIFMRGTTEDVPKNPNTIAATWSLLAGSKMLEEELVPLGSEWFDHTQLKETRLFEGHRFKLGWWEEKAGENGEVIRRRFGIDVDDVTDVAEETVFNKGTVADDGAGGNDEISVGDD